MASSVFMASPGWSGEIELVLVVMDYSNKAKGNPNAKLRPTQVIDIMEETTRSSYRRD
jgi:hypothetical protein